MKEVHSFLLIVVVLCLLLTACRAKGEVTQEAVEAATEEVTAEAEVQAEQVAAEAEAATEEPAALVEPTPTSAPEGEVAPPEEEATAVPATVKPTAIPTSTPVVEEAKPTAVPLAALELVYNLEDVLDSYRRRTTMRFREEDGSWGPEAKVETEWVRDPPASRTIMYDESGGVSLEIITMGDTTYTRFGDTWVKTKSQEMVPGEAAGAEWDWDMLLQDMRKAVQGGMTLVGEDVVNGVRCRHYAVDTRISIPYPVPGDASEEVLQMLPTEVTSTERGDAWVADQDGLRQIVVRWETQGEMSFRSASGERTMAMQNRTDVYDINVPITIEAPLVEGINVVEAEYPIMADAQVNVQTSGMTSYTTASSPEEVVEFYKTAMTAAGWIEGESIELADLTMIEFTKEGQSLSVRIMAAEEGPGSQVTVMSQ